MASVLSKMNTGEQNDAKTIVRVGVFIISQNKKRTTSEGELVPVLSL